MNEPHSSVVRVTFAAPGYRAKTLRFEGAPKEVVRVCLQRSSGPAEDVGSAAE